MRYRPCLVNLYSSRNTFWFVAFKSVEEVLSNLNMTRNDLDELKPDTTGLHLFRTKTPAEVNRRSLYIILDETHPLFNLPILLDDKYAWELSGTEPILNLPGHHVDMISDYTTNMLEDIAELYSNR